MDPYFAHEKYVIPRVKGYRVMHGRRGTLPPWAFGTDETVSKLTRGCFKINLGLEGLTFRSSKTGYNLLMSTKPTY